MQLLNFLQIFAAIVGSIAGIIAIVEIIKGKRALSFGFVLITIIIAFIFYGITLKKSHITHFKKERFKSTIENQTLLFINNDPIIQSDNSKSILDSLITLIQEDPRYQEEMPREVGILYRLYAATILFSQRGISFDPLKGARNAFPYLVKSKKYNQEIWKQPSDEASYQLIRKIKNYEIPSIELHEYLTSIYSIAMIGAPQNLISNKVSNFLGIINGFGSKAKRDFNFFNSRYKIRMFAFQKLMEANGAKFTGPIYFPTEDNKTLITYIATKDNKELKAQWLVDCETGLIEPMTKFAKELNTVAEPNK